MKQLLTTIVLLALTISALAQTPKPTNYQGSPLTNIGFRGGFVLDSTMRLLSYKGTPGGVDVMAINESGYVYLFSLDSAFSLISQVIIDTAEQLRDMDIDDIRKNGGMLTGDWDLNQNGKRVRFYGGKFEVDSFEVGDAYITNSLRYNAHTWNSYNEYSVPDVGWVETAISDSMTEFILSSPTSEKDIKYLSVEEDEGVDGNTIYFIPKSHLLLKEGQLFVSKYTGNSARYPELNDRVEGFMQNGSGATYYVIGKYNGTGSFYLKSNYTIISETAW